MPIGDSLFDKKGALMVPDIIAKVTPQHLCNISVTPL
jgi:hypothetical protein